MNLIITPADLHFFRKNHYPARLARATGDKEKRFLRNEIKNIKTASNVTDPFKTFHSILLDGDDRLFRYRVLPLLPQENYSNQGRRSGLPDKKVAAQMESTGTETPNEQTKI